MPASPPAAVWALLMMGSVMERTGTRAAKHASTVVRQAISADLHHCRKNVPLRGRKKKPLLRGAFLYINLPWCLAVDYAGGSQLAVAAWQVVVLTPGVWGVPTMAVLATTAA